MDFSVTRFIQRSKTEKEIFGSAPLVAWIVFIRIKLPPFRREGLIPDSLMALAALSILVFSLRGTWDSVRSQSGVDLRMKSLQRIWARTSTSILPPRTPQRYCSVRGAEQHGSTSASRGHPRFLSFSAW